MCIPSRGRANLVREPDRRPRTAPPGTRRPLRPLGRVLPLASSITDRTVRGREVTTVHGRTASNASSTGSRTRTRQQMTWWCDEKDRITGVMVRSLPGKETNRMRSSAWAAVHDPWEVEDSCRRASSVTPPAARSDGRHCWCSGGRRCVEVLSGCPAVDRASAS